MFRADLASILLLLSTLFLFSPALVASETESCDSRYDACMRGGFGQTPSPARTMMCQNDWTQCMSKCKVTGNTCSADSECQRSCTEEAGEDGRITSCCSTLAAPKAENPCQNKINVECKSDSEGQSPLDSEENLTPHVENKAVPQGAADSQKQSIADRVKELSTANPGSYQHWNDPSCVLVSCDDEPPFSKNEERIVSIPNDQKTVEGILRRLARAEDSSLIPTNRGDAGDGGQNLKFSSYDDTTGLAVSHLGSSDYAERRSLFEPSTPQAFDEHRGGSGYSDPGNSAPLLRGNEHIGFGNDSYVSLGEETFGPPRSAYTPNGQRATEVTDETRPSFLSTQATRVRENLQFYSRNWNKLADWFSRLW